MTDSYTLLGFDYGLRRIGVAVGQSITGTASPLPPLLARDGQPQWEQIAALIAEWKPARLVVGLPLTLDDGEQQLSAAARKFAKRLHGRYGLPVDTVDERLSTKAVRAELFERGGYKELQKKSVDSRAACLILEGWFEQH
ncbi:MAG: Holliday junction resolvase RuvX [Gammaproteobacteria bacterium]|nr:Holliday junction resolvase RuvX [Gammaproteobacteria bacterium]